MALGIERGEHIAIMAPPNLPEWVLLQFAAARIGGAVLVTINTNYKLFELEYLLHHSDVTTLIFSEGIKNSNYLEMIAELCPEIEESMPGWLVSKRLPKLKNWYLSIPSRGGGCLFLDPDVGFGRGYFR